MDDGADRLGVIVGAGLTLAYRRRRRAVVVPVRSASFTFDAPTTALTGPSGSGKSTLLRSIAGLHAPDEGEIRIGDQPVRSHPRRPRLDPRVALVHQDYRLAGFLTVGENVALGAQARGQRIERARVGALLEAVGLAGYERRRPDECSGGEQQRVAIARALAARPAVLVADEPTGALDAETTRQLVEVLVDVARHGTQVVVATHDSQVAAAMDDVWAVGAGTVRRARGSC